MNLKLADAIKHGIVDATKVYKGSTLIWPTTSPTVVPNNYLDMKAFERCSYGPEIYTVPLPYDPNYILITGSMTNWDPDSQSIQSSGRGIGGQLVRLKWRTPINLPENDSFSNNPISLTCHYERDGRDGVYPSGALNPWMSVQPSAVIQTGTNDYTFLYLKDNYIDFSDVYTSETIKTATPKQRSLYDLTDFTPLALGCNYSGIKSFELSIFIFTRASVSTDVRLIIDNVTIGGVPVEIDTSQGALLY